LSRFLQSLIVLASIFGPSARNAQAQSGRYVYVVLCDARVDKLDTASDRVAETYDLARRSGPRQLIPQVDGVLDGCLANETIYFASKSTFYTVVPTQAESRPDGSNDYRILGFSVPELQLVSDVAAGTGLGEAPHLEFDPAGIPKAIDQSKWVPQTDVDISRFRFAGAATRNEILESSAGHYLLRLFDRRIDELTIAVADEESKALVVLRDLPPTTALNVHLAPGGSYVLVEETGETRTSAVKTGRIVLYDSKTGSRIRSLSNPQIRKLYFLAISPNGKAIYHDSRNYIFVDLEQKASTDVVVLPPTVPSPGLFFADR
jgi:hypothetical protein